MSENKEHPHAWYLEKKLEQLKFEAKHFERRESDIMAGQCYYEIQQIEEELSKIKKEKL